MAGTPSDILNALQNGVQAVQLVAQKLATVFPQSTASSTVVPSSLGAITFTSSEPAGFLIIQTSSGFTCKVPFYPQ